MKLRTLSPNEFPALLKEIPDPPETLYLEGASIPEDLTRIAVVGSRKYTDYGRRATEKIIRELAPYKVAIVSGCALGIDSVAHQAAIQNNMYTVGIPGSGLDRSVFYPRSNYFLKEAILQSGGSLLSEFEPLQPATKWTFPQRNRIMAGMSEAVLVVEAAERSGTLITARLGLEYNREVFVVPGSIFSETSAGSNRLIRDGASPVLSGQDIIEELGLVKKEETEGKNEDHPDHSILGQLSEETSRDEFVSLVGDAQEAQILLSKLELQGKITQRGNTIFKN